MSLWRRSEEVLLQRIHYMCPVIGGGCSPRLQSSDIMVFRGLDEGIRPEFARRRAVRELLYGVAGGLLIDVLKVTEYKW